LLHFSSSMFLNLHPHEREMTKLSLKNYILNYIFWYVFLYKIYYPKYINTFWIIQFYMFFWNLKYFFKYINTFWIIYLCVFRIYFLDYKIFLKYKFQKDKIEILIYMEIGLKTWVGECKVLLVMSHTLKVTLHTPHQVAEVSILFGRQLANTILCSCQWSLIPCLSPILVL